MHIKTFTRIHTRACILTHRTCAHLQRNTSALRALHSGVAGRWRGCVLKNLDHAGFRCNWISWAAGRSCVVRLVSLRWWKQLEKWLLLSSFVVYNATSLSHLQIKYLRDFKNFVYFDGTHCIYVAMHDAFEHKMLQASTVSKSSLHKSSHLLHTIDINRRASDFSSSMIPLSH